MTRGGQRTRADGGGVGRLEGLGDGSGVGGLRPSHLALSRLNEFTDGLVIAVYAGACARRPPRNLRAVCESPCTSTGPPPQTFSPVAFVTSETCEWQPEPVSEANGLGMKVARRPCASASVRAMYLRHGTSGRAGVGGGNAQQQGAVQRAHLKKTTRSAVTSASS